MHPVLGLHHYLPIVHLFASFRNISYRSFDCGKGQGVRLLFVIFLLVIGGFVFESDVLKETEKSIIDFCKKWIKQGNAQRPEVRVVTWNNDELATDALPVHGFEHYKAKDYSLAHAPFSGNICMILNIFLVHIVQS